MTHPCSGKNEPTVTISGKKWRTRVSNLRTRHRQIRCYAFGIGAVLPKVALAEPKETKHENRKHAFSCALSGAFGRYVDITRLGAATPRVGGGRCTMSGSGRESISDRRRIRRYEERSRTWVSGLPSRPWLSSLSVGGRRRCGGPHVTPASALPRRPCEAIAGKSRQSHSRSRRAGLGRPASRELWPVRGIRYSIRRKKSVQTR
jgi:hypothetical protein